MTNAPFILFIAGFISMVYAVYLFESKDKTFKEKYEVELKNVGSQIIAIDKNIVALAEILTTQNASFKSVDKAISNITLEIDSLKKKIEWHEVKLQVLSQKPMRINVRLNDKVANEVKKRMKYEQGARA